MSCPSLNVLYNLLLANMENLNKNFNNSNNNDNKNLKQNVGVYRNALRNSSKGTPVNSMGVVLANRPVTSVSQRGSGYNADNAVANETIEEPGWTLNNMLERFSFKASYPWLSSSPSHTVLAQLRVPQDLIVSTVTSVPFSSFCFWRGDVEIRFQVTATPFHQGLAVAAFVPLTDNTFATENIISNFSSLSVNQCCYLYPNVNTSAVMKIPFNSPQTYLDLTSPGGSFTSTLGYLYVVVFNQLQLSANATDTCTVSIFSRFLNNSFKVPRKSTLVASPQSIERSQLTGLVKSVANEAIDNVAATVLPETISAESILNSVGVAMLDKPTDVRQEMVHASLTGRMNFSTGVEHLDKLTLEPSQTFESTSQTFATNVDEMEMSYLYSKYSYLGSFNVTTDQLPGTIVARFPMNPIPNVLTLDRNKVPMLSYLVFPFKFWRGGLNYKLQIVATSLQTCKLFIALNYNEFTPVTTMDVNQATSQYGEVIEINQGSNEFEFSVPFVSVTPYKAVPTSNSPSQLDSLGFINVVVLNRLVAPNNTPITITCNLFISGSSDFEANTLSTANNVTPFTIPPPTNDFEMLPASPQSNEVVQPITSTSNDVSLASDFAISPIQIGQFSQAQTQVAPFSLQHLLKKYQPILCQATDYTSDDISLFGFPIASIFRLYQPALGNPSTTYTANNGLLSYYAAIFRQMRGPLRFKITNEFHADGDIVLTAFFEPPHFNTGGGRDEALVSNIPAFDNSAYPPFGLSSPPNSFNLLRNPISKAGVGIAKFLEFEVPFSTIFASALTPYPDTYTSYETNASNLGRVQIYKMGGNPNTFLNSLQTFVSIGDEFRLANVYRVPEIVVPYTWNATTAQRQNVYPNNYLPVSPSTNSLFIL